MLVEAAVEAVASYPVIDGWEWNPETWGESDEAQAALAHALQLSGPPADAQIG